MNSENRKELETLIEKLKKFRDEVYDYNYDEYALWHLDEAIRQLERI